jgi:hypothetical protein
MAIGNILANDTHILLQGGTSGNIAVDPDCCCVEPCDTCVPDYDATAMPDTVYLDTPFGVMTCTKQTTPTQDCTGQCFETDGVLYVYFECKYNLQALRTCSISRQDAYKQCTNTHTQAHPACGLMRTTVTLDGEIVYLFEEKAVTCMQSASGIGNQFLTVKQRKNCVTNAWQIAFELRYLFTQQIYAYFEGTVVTVQEQVTPNESCPSGNVFTTTTSYNVGRDWCSLAPGDPIDFFGSAFYERDDDCLAGFGGLLGQGCVNASTAWLSSSGFNATKLFGTILSNANNQSGANCNTCNTTTGGNTAKYTTFASPTGSSDFFDCSYASGVASLAFKSPLVNIDYAYTVVDCNQDTGNNTAWIDHEFSV